MQFVKQPVVNRMSSLNIMVPYNQGIISHIFCNAGKQMVSIVAVSVNEIRII